MKVFCPPLRSVLNHFACPTCFFFPPSPSVFFQRAFPCQHRPRRSPFFSPLDLHALVMSTSPCSETENHPPVPPLRHSLYGPLDQLFFCLPPPPALGGELGSIVTIISSPSLSFFRLPRFFWDFRLIGTVVFFFSPHDVPLTFCCCFFPQLRWPTLRKTIPFSRLSHIW